MSNYSLFKTIFNHLNRDGGQNVWSQSMVFLCASKFDLETCRVIAKKLFSKYPEFARKMADNFGYEPIEFLSYTPLRKRPEAIMLSKRFLSEIGVAYVRNGVPYTGTGYQITDGMFSSDIFVTEEDTYPFAYVNSEIVKFNFINGIIQ